MGDHTGNSRADSGPGVIKITKAGWLYIAVTLFLGFSAVNTGNNLVYLIVAAFLSFMGISGFFGRRNLSKIDITLGLPEEIYARTGFPLKITLTNNKGFLPAFLIKARFLDHEVLFPFVDPRGNDLKYIPFSLNERGIVSFGDIYVCSVFPFNFFMRCRKIDRVFETVVFPQMKKCALPDIVEEERKSRGEKSVDRPGHEAEIISTRDYIKGDPLKYIHWKASARTGKLKTKELSTLSHRPIIIDFDSVLIRNLEEKISCVTYIIVRLFKQNVPVGLRISGSIFTPLGKSHHERTKAGRTAMLKMLALYGKE
ncbi:MAG TPA: DUF58 domain-containing protein [Thermodesulfovibrionales bacterium]|nr:DUF58 domain-containing protein [Thermodesulfovibrionales bacterium]